MADGDALAARDWLRAPIEPGGRSILPWIPIDTTDEVQLARIAQAAQDSELGRLAIAASRRRADLNPGVRSIAAIAAHVRGLVEDSKADPDTPSIFSTAVRGPSRSQRRSKTSAAALGPTTVRPESMPSAAP